MLFSEKILSFNDSLHLDPKILPKGVSVMNPFKGQKAEEIHQVTHLFYNRYYADTYPRYLILGINPGRFGAGVTGVPFTDTKRMKEHCRIDVDIDPTHEPSSVFVYKVIDALGGPVPFYRTFYINSISPLGFTRLNSKGNEVNYNYYDDRSLQQAVLPFIEDSIERQLAFGVHTDLCFCMGRGKNYTFLKRLNKKKQWFDQIVPLDHPRFIVQYRSRKMDEYVQAYTDALSGCMDSTR
ncbi:DUF4918 family protein [Balneolaceae bacterium ANBcel3]|nr:DUF4918 family protein [Balneolaceae bacterium ANBcel3]